MLGSAVSMDVVTVATIHKRMLTEGAKSVQARDSSKRCICFQLMAQALKNISGKTDTEEYLFALGPVSNVFWLAK